MRCKALAIAAEDAARAVAGVTNSEGGGASAGRAVMALATSGGFARGYRGTSYGVSASVIAGAGQAMQRDYAYHSARHFADLDAAEAIGREAGERAARRRRSGQARHAGVADRLRPARRQLAARPSDRRDHRRRDRARDELPAATRSAPRCSRPASRSATIRTASAACARARSTARACRPRHGGSSTAGA